MSQHLLGSNLAVHTRVKRGLQVDFSCSSIYTRTYYEEVNTFGPFFEVGMASRKNTVSRLRTLSRHSREVREHAKRGESSPEPATRSCFLMHCEYVSGDSSPAFPCLQQLFDHASRIWTTFLPIWQMVVPC